MSTPADNSNIPPAPPIEGIPDAPPMDGIPPAPDMDGIPPAPDMDGGIPPPPPMGDFGASTSSAVNKPAAKPLSAREAKSKKLTEELQGKSKAEIESLQKKYEDNNTAIRAQIQGLGAAKVQTAREQEAARSDKKRIEERIKKISKQIEQWSADVQHPGKVAYVARLSVELKSLQEALAVHNKNIPDLEKQAINQEAEAKRLTNELDSKRYEASIYRKALELLASPTSKKEKNAAPSTPKTPVKHKGDPEAAEEYSQLINYMYDEQGKPDTFPLEVLREEYFKIRKNKLAANATEIDTVELQRFIKTELEMGMITKEEIQKMAGFDVIAAKKARAKHAANNRKQSDELANLNNLRYDQNGNPTNEPLTKLKNFFKEELFFKDSALEDENFLRKNIDSGAINAAQISNIVGFDILKSIENKKELNRIAAEKAKAEAELKTKQEAEEKSKQEAEAKTKTEAKQVAETKVAVELQSSKEHYSSDQRVSQSSIVSYDSEIQKLRLELATANERAATAEAKAKAAEEMIAKTTNPAVSPAIEANTPPPSATPSRKKGPELPKHHDNTSKFLQSTCHELDKYIIQLKHQPGGIYSGGLQFWKSNQQMKLEAAKELREYFGKMYEEKLNNNTDITPNIFAEIHKKIEKTKQENVKADRFGYHPHGKLEKLLNAIENDTAKLQQEVSQKHNLNLPKRPQKN